MPQLEDHLDFSESASSSWGSGAPTDSTQSGHVLKDFSGDDDMDVQGSVSVPPSPVETLTEIQQNISYEMQVIPEGATLISAATSSPVIVDMKPQNSEPWTIIEHNLSKTTNIIRAESTAFVSPLTLLKVLPPLAAFRSQNV